MASQALERYIELKRQISDLEKELDELKDKVFADVDGKGGEIDDGIATIDGYSEFVKLNFKKAKS